MKKVIFNANMGEGFVLENNDILEVEPESSFVANEILIPGTFTSMSGYFKHSLEFCGTFQKKGLVFHIGDEGEFPHKKRYYQLVHLITEFRLFSMFSYQAGRDFNYRKGEWK